jgi:hypothetical protein
LAIAKEWTVQTEEQNYGVVGDHDTNRAVKSMQEEKSLSVLAHLSVFLNLFTGFWDLSWRW